MKKLLFSVAAMATMVFCANAQDITVNFNAWVNESTSIDFGSGVSGSFDASPGNGTGNNICNGGAIGGSATRRIQANHITLDFSGSTIDVLGGLQFAANSSGAASRTILSIEVGGVAVEGWSATHLPTGAANSDGTCGIIEVSGLNIPKASPVKITFASWAQNSETQVWEPGTTPQNIRFVEIKLIASTNNSVGNVTDDGCTVTGYFNILGQNLGQEEPASGVYIVTYDNCPAKKFVK